jgi:hypothetical protein
MYCRIKISSFIIYNVVSVRIILPDEELGGDPLPSLGPFGVDDSRSDPPSGLGLINGQELKRKGGGGHFGGEEGKG